MNGGFEVEWAGDSHLRVRAGADRSEETRRRVLAAAEALARAAIHELDDVVPAYATLLIRLKDDAVDPRRVRELVISALDQAHASVHSGSPREVEIPVCYERPFAPDLDSVAAQCGLSAEDVVVRHSAAEYRVCFIGFSPGFPYLSGLPGVLSVPRLDRPRVRVPAGSVAIAGEQAGVYPRSTAGGWNLIGRTPLKLFDAGREPPSMLAAGDRVRFVPITAAKFAELQPGNGA